MAGSKVALHSPCRREQAAHFRGAGGQRSQPLPLQQAQVAQHGAGRVAAWAAGDAAAWMGARAAEVEAPDWGAVAREQRVGAVAEHLVDAGIQVVRIAE